MAKELKGKIPPHDLEAEQSVLGALMLDWSSIGNIVTFLKPEDFYNRQNSLIYEALLSLFKSSNKGDIITVTDTLRESGHLEEAGGVAYVSSLTDIVPTSANIEFYAQIVLDRSMRRELIRISSEISKQSFDETKESRNILEDAEKRIFKLTDANQSAKIIPITDVVTNTIKLIDERYKNKNAYTGIPSGIIDLDNMTSGFQNSEMIIIGARPSMGKTALALSMIQHIAVEKKIPCGFFSLEMASNQIGQRLLSQVARVTGTKLRNGLFNISDFQKLQDAAGECYSSPLYIVDIPNMRLLDLRTMARRMKAKHGVKIIFIDYIGLITSEIPDAPMYEQQSAISKSLKSLARELEIPIVVLCQVARSAESSEPSLAQLRGSGSIEQDADMVIFISGKRDDKSDEDESNPSIQERRLIVAKQRNGPIGNVDVLFFSSYTKFENIKRE